MKTIKHILDITPSKEKPKVTQPEDEFKKSFFVLLFKNICICRKKNVTSFRNSLKNYDWNKDMRIIGRANYWWQNLRGKKMLLSFIVKNQAKKNSGKFKRRASIYFDNVIQPKKRSPCLIMPTSYFSLMINFIANMAYTISFFLVLFVIASRMSLLDELQPYELVIDLILFFEMITRFLTAYDNDLEQVTDLRTISVRYVSNWFIFDFIAIVPGLITGEMFPVIYPLKLLRYLRLARFFEQMNYA